MNKKVLAHLKEFFYHIADAVDGGDPLPDGLRDAYEKAWKDKAFREFYSAEVDANHAAKAHLL